MPKKQTARSAPAVLFVNGPNLATLGFREPEVYGDTPLSAIVAEARSLAEDHGVRLLDVQSNHEGILIDFLNEHFLESRKEPARAQVRGVVINPGGLTHTSVALRDALAMYDREGVPIAEVHLSNIYRREAFRRESLVSPVATVVVSGLGAQGYRLAMEWLLKGLKKAT